MAAALASKASCPKGRESSILSPSAHSTRHDSPRAAAAPIPLEGERRVAPQTGATWPAAYPPGTPAGERGESARGSSSDGQSATLPRLRSRVQVPSSALRVPAGRAPAQLTQYSDTRKRGVGQRLGHLFWEQEIGGSSPSAP